MKTKLRNDILWLILVTGLIVLSATAQQIGTSISANEALPNDNAILDIQSPTTGDGKGLLIPRVTQTQRTTADAGLAGGLLDDSGNLRGGAAQGLLVYQTDGLQGLYYNTSGSASTSWCRVGDLHSDGSVAMASNLNMGTKTLSNVHSIAFSRYDVQIGMSARASSSTSGNVAIGRSAVARYGYGGVAIGCGANGDSNGTALGYQANGYNTNIALGFQANAGGGKDRIAIGRGVVNHRDNSCVIKGTLYLDGGTGLLYRQTVGSGGWIAKAFTIPHPLTPHKAVLRHFCAEGPQVLNIYEGSAQLINGEAIITLPDYYSALNLVGSEVYDLTPIGAPTSLYIKQEIANNEFVIAGDRDVEFSWIIHVRRNDPACLEDLKRRPVEQMKRDMPNGQIAQENRSLNTTIVAERAVSGIRYVL